MDPRITIVTAGFTLLSSGTMLAIDQEPIQMNLSLDRSILLSVELHFLAEYHPGGRSMERYQSKDGSVEKWHIFDSINGESGHTISPVPVISYVDEGVLKTVCLQLHTTKLSSGSIKIDYAWWTGTEKASVKN